MKDSPTFRRLASGLALAGLALIPLSGCQKQPVSVPPSVPSPTPHMASAEPTHFDAVTRHLDPGGSAYCYFSTDQIIRWFSDYWQAMEPVIMQGATSKMEPAGKARTEMALRFATDFIAQSGIKDIGAFGYSSIALEPGYYQQRMMVYHDPAKRDSLYWKIRSAEPNAVSFMDYLPANTAFGSNGNTKLLPIWEELNRRAEGTPEVKELLNDAANGFQKATGLDLAALLGSLGPNFFTVLTLDEAHPVTIPAGPIPITVAEPALTFWAQLQNDLLTRKLEEMLSKNPMAVKSEADGWTVYKFNLPIPMPWVHPAVVWNQGTVAVFSNDALFTEMLAVKGGKKPGLTASADFIKLRKGMPENGSYACYIAPSFLRVAQSIQRMTSGAQAAQDPAAKQMMDKIQTLNTPYAAYAVHSDLPEGSVGIVHQKNEPK